jgi:hypothetical protein
MREDFALGSDCLSPAYLARKSVTNLMVACFGKNMADHMQFAAYEKLAVIENAIGKKSGHPRHRVS